MSVVPAWLVLVVVLAGCGGPDVIFGVEAASETATATADRATTFGEVLVDQPTVPDEQASTYVGIAADGDGLASARNRFLVDAPIEADLDRDVLLFLGFGESGSCPLEYRGLVLDGATVEFVLDPELGERTCTDDYNPRTLVLAVGRDRLPPGPIEVLIPSADAAATVSVEPVPAPQEDVVDVNAPISPDGVVLRARPEEVAVGGTVSVVLRSSGPAVAEVGGPAALEVWDGRQWLPADPGVPPGSEIGGRALVGEEVRLVTLDMGALGLGAGSYRVLADVGFATGPLDASEPAQTGSARLAAHFDVVDPETGSGTDGAASP